MRLSDFALIFAVSGAVTLNTYSSGALTISLSSIGKSLGFSQSNLQWPVTVNNLSYGCLLLFFGRVSDIVGARILFLCGSAFVGVFSIVAAFAPSDKIFIICEALLGVGSAVNTPAAIGLLVHHFPPGPSRNRAMGIMGAFQPIGYVLGLILGGVLTGSKASWHATFYIQAGLAFFFGLLGYKMFDADGSSSAKYTKGLDWVGAVLSTAGIAMLTYSLADSSSAVKGWATPRVPGILSASLVVLALFVLWEHRQEARDAAVLMPLSIWKNPRAKMPYIMGVVFFGWFSFNCLMYWMTLYFEQVLYASTLLTAVQILPMIVSGVAINLISGLLVNRVSSAILMAFGLMGNVIAPLIFALINPNASYWAMAFPALILNAWADVAFPIVSLHLSQSFTADSQSLAASLFSVAIRLGTALGMAITSSIATEQSKKYSKSHSGLDEVDPSVLMYGYRAASWTCFAAGVIAVFIIVLGLRDLGIVGYVGQKSTSAEDPFKDVDVPTNDQGIEMQTPRKSATLRADEKV